MLAASSSAMTELLGFLTVLLCFMLDMEGKQRQAEQEAEESIAK